MNVTKQQKTNRSMVCEIHYVHTDTHTQTRPHSNIHTQSIQNQHTF